MEKYIMLKEIESNVLDSVQKNTLIDKAKLVEDLNCLDLSYEEKTRVVEYMENINPEGENYFELRICSLCGKFMIEGYILFEGEEYYCINDCLEITYTDSTLEELRKNDDLYYTEWY